MSHIFFERLEKRQSTQSLLPAFGGNTFGENTPIAIYSVQVPDPGWGNIGYNPVATPPNLLYAINLPSTPGSGGYFPWYGGGLFGGTGYNGWTNPFGNYNPYGSWGFGNFFSGLFGGFFGGTSQGPWGYTRPTVPDFRLLYGVFPSPQPLYGISITPSPPANIVLYGIGVTTTRPLPPTNIGSIIAYYGVAIPDYGFGTIY
ncbi:hypothetical protein JXL19_07355 [bacterium]|nr:hypothetical protein [bacterium]